MPREKLERRGEKPQWRSRAKEWVARVWEKDGTCSGWTPLGNNKEHAFATYARWLQTGEAPSEKGQVTFAAAAERFLTEEEGSGVPSDIERAKDRRSRLRNFALPSLGLLPVERLQPHHVTSVLKAMVKTHGKGAGTVGSMRSDISQILEMLKGEGAVAVNVARGLAMPKDARVDTRERMTLTDEQILAFQYRRGFTTQLDMMVLFTRQVAGHRTSDEHAGLWEETDVVHFAEMKVRRPKTDGETGQNARVGKRRVRAYEKVTHEIDEQYRGHLRAYWVAQGRPASGPIFPLLRDGVSTPMTLKDGTTVLRKGGKVGERKGTGTSYALPLRRAVWACGIYAPMPKGTLIEGVPTTETFDPEHPDPGLCFLQTDTDSTRRLDFKGLRASLVTAMADAKVDTATSLAVTGHTQLSTQLRHYMGKRRVRVPAAALPGGAVEPAPSSPSAYGAAGLTPEQRAALEVLLGRPAKLPEVSGSWDSIPRSGMELAPSASMPTANSLESLARPVGFEPTTSGLEMPRMALHGQEVPVNTTAVPALTSAAERVPSHVLGGNDTARATLLAAAAKAVAEDNWALADSIRALLDAAPIAKPLASVRRLSDARKRTR